LPRIDRFVVASVDAVDKSLYGATARFVLEVAPVQNTLGKDKNDDIRYLVLQTPDDQDWICAPIQQDALFL